MWFRNLLVYRLVRSISLTTDTLETALATRPARPCPSQELSSYGFIPPIGKSEHANLVHAGGDFLLLATRKEERILPSSVIRERLQEKVEEIEAQQMRKVYKKEREQLKEELLHSLMPHAFIRKTLTYAAIAPKLGLILVDTASTKKAEDLLSTLREALGSLPVRPLTLKTAPSATLTQWLKQQPDNPSIKVLDECELQDSHEDGGSIRCKRQDLGSEEILQHLNTGKRVTQLSLAWQDKLSFVLDDKMSIKRLRFEALLQEQAETEGGDDEQAQRDASFMLMMLTFNSFLPELIESMGGEDSIATE